MILRGKKTVTSPVSTHIPTPAQIMPQCYNSSKTGNSSTRTTIIIAILAMIMIAVPVLEHVLAGCDGGRLEHILVLGTPFKNLLSAIGCVTEDSMHQS